MAGGALAGKQVLMVVVVVIVGGCGDARGFSWNHNFSEYFRWIFLTSPHQSGDSFLRSIIK